MDDGIATIEPIASAAPPPTSNESDWLTWINRDASEGFHAPTRRVLLIAYQFPPTGGSGVYRPAGLCQWLGAFGWAVDVLTAGHSRFPWRDDALMDQVPDTTPVHRVRGWEPGSLAERLTFTPLHDTEKGARERTGGAYRSRDTLGRLRVYLQDRLFWRLSGLTQRLGMGNGESLWIGAAVRRAFHLHHRTAFDAVISTGPPHVAHEVARRVALQAGLPWLADVRDPMISDFDRDNVSGAQAKRMHTLESTVLNQADGIMTTCPSLAEQWKARYPHREHAIQSVTNGFNRRQIASIAKEAIQGCPDICHFVAAGAFYGKREIARLIEPLSLVLKSNPKWQQRVRLTIAGTIDEKQRASWSSRLPQWVELAGYISRDEALRLTARASCNILMVPQCQHGRLSIPGKTFDLLALPRHLLALVPDNSDTERIVSSVAGTTCTPLESESGIASAMHQIIKRHLSGQAHVTRQWSALDCYDQRDMAGCFAEALDRLTEQGTATVDRTKRQDEGVDAT